MDKLRKDLGDRKWREFLRGLYRDYKGHMLTYENFVGYLSKYSQSCANKFEEWVTVTGFPKNY